eukprot:4877912-Amphidinium_carterae.1
MTLDPQSGSSGSTSASCPKVMDWIWQEGLDEQYGVIVYGDTGTPALSMDEPTASNIHSIYRDPRRQYMDNDDHTGR